MRKIRYILWALVVIAVGFMAYLLMTIDTNPRPNKLGAGEKLGGEFNLIQHNGKPITDKDLLGKPHIIFFGFTTCPEICPTTLHEISTWLDELGADADKLGVYFITVDPERDTKELLSEYLSFFDSRIIGITGEKNKVEEVLRSFKVYFNRVELEGGDYTMDHTAIVFRLNAKGEFVGSIDYEENSETAVAKLRMMLK